MSSVVKVVRLLNSVQGRYVLPAATRQHNHRRHGRAADAYTHHSASMFGGGQSRHQPASIRNAVGIFVGGAMGLYLGGMDVYNLITYETGSSLSRMVS
jgi:hypothetical protein